MNYKYDYELRIMNRDKLRLDFIHCDDESKKDMILKYFDDMNQVAFSEKGSILCIDDIYIHNEVNEDVIYIFDDVVKYFDDSLEVLFYELMNYSYAQLKESVDVLMMM